MEILGTMYFCRYQILKFGEGIKNSVKNMCSRSDKCEVRMPELEYRAVASDELIRDTLEPREYEKWIQKLLDDTKIKIK